MLREVNHYKRFYLKM